MAAVSGEPLRRWYEGGWPSFDKARADYRELLDKLLAEGIIPGTPVPAAHYTVLAWLVEGHPGAEQMLDGGIRHFTIHSNGVGRAGFGFSVVNGYGVEHSFSYRVALTGRFKSGRQKSMEAFRKAVFAQIKTFRGNAVQPGATCPETGENLRLDSVDIDHVGKSFLELVASFLRDVGVAIGDVALEDLKLGCKLQDENFTARWQRFHFQNAKLEALSVRGHQIRTRRRREE